MCRLVVLLLFISGAAFAKQHTIGWNSTNPWFSISQWYESEGVPHLRVRMGDSIRIECPRRGSGEVLLIGQVSDMGLLECMRDGPRRIVVSCSDNNRNQHHVIPVRKFSPLPNGLEFKPGDVFHWLSTSSGRPDGVHATIGGLCMKKNMRVRIEVLEADEEKTTAIPTTTTTTAPAPVEELPREGDRKYNPRFVVPTREETANLRRAGVRDDQLRLMLQSLIKEVKDDSFLSATAYHHDRDNTIGGEFNGETAEFRSSSDVDTDDIRDYQIGFEDSEASAGVRGSGWLAAVSAALLLLL